MFDKWIIKKDFESLSDKFNGEISLVDFSNFITQNSQLASLTDWEK